MAVLALQVGTDGDAREEISSAARVEGKGRVLRGPYLPLIPESRNLSYGHPFIERYDMPVSA